MMFEDEGSRKKHIRAAVAQRIREIEEEEVAAGKCKEAPKFKCVRPNCEICRGGRTIKDHEIAQAVNTLRDIAIEFHGTQQLRERIAEVLRPLFKKGTPL